jgi:hypothetical protein
MGRCSQAASAAGEPLLVDICALASKGEKKVAASERRVRAHLQQTPNSRRPTMVATEYSRIRVLAETVAQEAPQVRARDPDPGHAVPWRLRRRKWRYRAGFAGFVLFLTLLSLTTPRTYVYAGDGQLDFEQLFFGCVLLLVVLMAHFAISLSDPGYLDAQSAVRIREEQALHRDEEEGGLELEERRAPRRIIVSNERKQGSVSGLDDLDQTQQQQQQQQQQQEEKEDGAEARDAAGEGEATGLLRAQLGATPGAYEEDDEEPNEAADSAMSGVPFDLLPVRAKFCRRSRRIVATYDQYVCVCVCGSVRPEATAHPRAAATACC